MALNQRTPSEISNLVAEAVKIDKEIITQLSAQANLHANISGFYSGSAQSEEASIQGSIRLQQIVSALINEDVSSEVQVIEDVHSHLTMDSVLRDLESSGTDKIERAKDNKIKLNTTLASTRLVGSETDLSTINVKSTTDIIKYTPGEYSNVTARTLGTNTTGVSSSTPGKDLRLDVKIEDIPAEVSLDLCNLPQNTIVKNEQVITVTNVSNPGCNYNLNETLILENKDLGNTGSQNIEIPVSNIEQYNPQTESFDIIPKQLVSFDSSTGTFDIVPNRTSRCGSI